MPLATEGPDVMKEQKEKKRSFRKGKKGDLCLGGGGLPRPSAREATRGVITGRGAKL